MKADEALRAFPRLSLSEPIRSYRTLRRFPPALSAVGPRRLQRRGKTTPDALTLRRLLFSLEPLALPSLPPLPLLPHRRLQETPMFMRVVTDVTVVTAETAPGRGEESRQPRASACPL